MRFRVECSACGFEREFNTEGWAAEAVDRHACSTGHDYPDDVDVQEVRDV